MLAIFQQSKFIALGATIWATAVVAGVILIWAHDMQPGETSHTPIHWHENSNIQFDTSRPNVVLYAHPKCPCTRASLRQLASLPRSLQPAIRVVFVTPWDDDDSWYSGASIELAKQIQNAEVIFARGGREIESLGVTTSGHCVAYRADGRLAFSGGLTASRGHEGPNAGLSMLIAAIENSPGLEFSEVAKYPVYGCRLSQ